MIGQEDVPGGAIQPRAAALRAGLAVQELREFLANCAGLGLAIAPFEIRYDALEAVSLADFHAAGVLLEEIDLVAAAAEQDDLLQLVVEFLEGRLDIELVVIREATDHLVIIGCTAVPAADRAAGER